MNLVLLAGVLAVVAAACNPAAEPSTSSDAGRNGSSSTSITVAEDTVVGVVSAIVNGDTVQVIVGSEQITVRLAGVRAPHGEECYAAGAAADLAAIAGGSSVALVGDGEDAGMPVRYLIIEGDIPMLVNLELVAMGGAAALHGHDLAGDFLRVNDQAYASGKGMWGTFVCGQPDRGAPDRPQLRIEDVRPPAPPDPGSLGVINASYSEVALGGWTIRDVAGTPGFVFPSASVIPPGETTTVPVLCAPAVQPGPAVCFDDQMWAVGGTILIQDERGNVVDRFVYQPEDTP
jgi:endonuclease YncB( thermonuclease family)